MYRTLTQRRFMLVFVALTVMRVSGCAYQPGSFGDLTGGFNLIPQDMEIQIGSEAANEVETEEQVFNQPYIQDYVNMLGQRLAQASRRPDISYQFKVIDTDDINAFALPGGFIYVNRGLIEEAGSEAELAGVLAHEIGHVAARHGAKRMSKLIALQLGFALFWELSEKERDEELGLMIADAIATGFLLKNSRDDERQAEIETREAAARETGQADAGQRPETGKRTLAQRRADEDRVEERKAAPWFAIGC